MKIKSLGIGICLSFFGRMFWEFAAAGVADGDGV